MTSVEWACAEPTLPAINCPKPGGNVSVETSKVTSAGYSRRLRERTGQTVSVLKTKIIICKGVLHPSEKCCTFT